MGALGALMLTLSGLSPTIGVFVVGADVIHQAGAASLACFTAAAALGVAMAFVYAELVSAFPETGAEYTILTRVLGPAAGFAALGLNLVNFTVAQALSGLGVADYLAAVAPGISPRVVALALVAGVTALAVLGVRFNAILTGAFLTLEAVSLVVLSGLGFAHPHRPLGHALVEAFTPAAGTARASLAVMGAASAAAVYAFDGYGSVVLFGEEVREARRRTAAVVFWSLGLAIVLQLTPILALSVGAPDMAAIAAAPQPVIAFVRALGGERLAEVISLAVALAVFNAMLAIALMAARQLYATGRDRLWPAPVNRALTALHPRFGSPWVAALVMGGASFAWCFAPLDFLVTVIAGITVITYLGLAVAVVVGRRTRRTAAGVYAAPLHPLAPAFAFAALVGVIAVSLADPKEGRPGLIAAGAVVAGSIAVYAALRRAGSAFADRGPGATGADTDSPSG